MPGPVGAVIDFLLSNPPTWPSAIASTLSVFLLGSKVLATGLTFPGATASLLLGTLSWRAYGPRGFTLVCAYFTLGTAATRIKLKQKQAQGVAEARGGRRGPGSVVGSGAAGCVCAALAIWGAGTSKELWELGFVASFCTKLGDTVASEIGKAYGRTTYLVTNFKIVSRGTEGAVSVEGTLASQLTQHTSIYQKNTACFLPNKFMPTSPPILQNVSVKCVPPLSARDYPTAPHATENTQSPIPTNLESYHIQTLDTSRVSSTPIAQHSFEGHQSTYQMNAVDPRIVC